VDTPNIRPAGGSPTPYAIVFLVVAVLVGLGAVTLYERPAPNTVSCLALTDDDERLACYDTEFHRVAEQPAKGANVPLPR
jgi:hypothetical protein